MPHELPKAYEPGAIETRWAEYWVQEKLFHVEAPKSTDQAKETFTILLPPPNVTGALHMGHMLEHTESDILVRWRRMCGQPTLWIPGTDHAGIATQMLVERDLASQGINRRQLGREKFLERVWQWREHYGGTILKQMKRLGTSVDWDREYFTMDERLSRAVKEVFVRLYDEGLIYRGNYIVNWCPRCVTAISDLEVVHEDTQGKLWQIKYPISGSPNEFITVATTRPETMLGDTAVAINAADVRYNYLHGRNVMLPLMDREIPIILDNLAQPEFGTGAVKVTPAHDPNDYEAGLRHDLPQIVVMDEVGRMTEQAGKYAGLDRFEARERVVHDLEALGLLAGTKDYVVPLGKCQRCKTIVEPRLSTQWFVAVNKEPAGGGMTIQQAASKVVEDGSIKFTPENYKTIYLQWMENLYDWCISRQLWWGHRIPAWHCAQCRTINVAREAPTKCSHCGSASLEQDPDVLDTWFSSALLPFTSLGWPDDTPDLRAFYPTTLILNGFDILFFWDARMVIMGTHFMLAPHRPTPVPEGKDELAESVPFRDVYIHALVRDAERQKMSKTKGNVMDPIEVIERYGTDATRFTLAAQAAPGTDIAFNESRTEGYRAFANKIWNAARFMFMNLDKAGFRLQASGFRQDEPGVAAFKPATLEDRWILSRFNRVAGEVNDALATYRFHEAAHVIYDFFWGEFCDWYLELIKPRLNSDNRQTAGLACANLVALFEAALRLLSPIMPFITEEIWHAIYAGKTPLKSIALAPYPRSRGQQIDAEAETEMAILQDLIVSVRNVRAELKVETRLVVPIQVHAGDGVRRIVENNRGAIEKQANVSEVAFVRESLAKQPGARTTARFEVRVLYEKQIDKAAERERLSKELARIEKEIENAERQLANAAFLSKAPPKVVEGLRKSLEEKKVLREKIRTALAELG
jgi:valyl-tRNA synthetase